MEGDVLNEAPLVLTYYSGFFSQMNKVNSLRLKIRWPHAPLLKILLLNQADMSDGLLSLMDSWFYSWWLRIACCVYAKRYKNLSIYSNVILGIPVLWITPHTNPSWCGFFFISGQCYGYSLVPFRETKIPCYLGCCFEGTIFRSLPWVSPSTLPGN